MWPELIAVAWLVGQFVYHRLTDTDPAGPNPAQDLTIPRVDSGAPIPLIYGRCRVKAPLLAWLGTPHYYDMETIASYLGSGGNTVTGSTGVSWIDGTTVGGGMIVYGCDMLFILGVGTNEQVNGIHSIWAGEQRLTDTHLSTNWTVVHSGISHATSLSNLVGDGGAAYSGNVDQIGESHSRQAVYMSPNWGVTPPEINGGVIEFLNGHPAQELVDPAGSAPTGFMTIAGSRMVNSGGFGGNGTAGVPYAQLPGYRNYMSAFLTGMGGAPWLVGANPQVPSYSFEVSSYLAETFCDLTNGTRFVGTLQLDMNPIDVLWDIITAYFGKMGYTSAPIDSASWASAANTLWEENNGYSRAIEDGQTAADVIMEIQKQIDGIVYEDTTGLLKIKLIRGDYDPRTIFVINQDNCEDLEDLAFGGWQGNITRVIVKYRNRQLDYNEDSITVQNQANAVGQDNQVYEVQLDFPGICETENAKAIALRELAVRSKPLAKCKALMDRSAYRLNPGDPVMVNFPRYNISNMVFRVAKKPTGTLLDGKMAVDLLQDPYFIHQFRIILPPGTTDVFGF